MLTLVSSTILRNYPVWSLKSFNTSMHDPVWSWKNLDQFRRSCILGFLSGIYSTETNNLLCKKAFRLNLSGGNYFYYYAGRQVKGFNRSTLRWLITVSSIFLDEDFDGSLLPVFIT